MSTLSRSAATCDLCRLLESACNRDGTLFEGDLLVERSQSNLKLSSSDLPILSILRSAGRQPNLSMPQIFINVSYKYDSVRAAVGKL